MEVIMALKIKIPIKDIVVDSVERKIEERLREDKKNAYTIMGIMIELFNVKEQDMRNKSFPQWKEGLPSLYTKVRVALERLVENGKAKKAKHGKAFVYWWVDG
jgi:hypothetical protein